MGRASVRTAMTGLALAGIVFVTPARGAQELGAEQTAAAAVLVGGERWHGPRGFKGYGFHGRHGLHRFGGRTFHPFKEHAFRSHRFHPFKGHGFHTFKRHGFHRFEGHGINGFKGFGFRSFPGHRRHGHHRSRVGTHFFFFGAPSHGFNGIVVGPFRRHDAPLGGHYRRSYGER